MEKLVTERLDLLDLSLGVRFQGLSSRWLGVEVHHLSLQEVLLTFLLVSELLPMFGLLLNGLRLLFAFLDLLLQSLQLGLVLLLDFPRFELRGSTSGGWLRSSLSLGFRGQKSCGERCVLAGCHYFFNKGLDIQLTWYL